MVAHAFLPSTQEAEAGSRPLRVTGQPGLQNKVKDGQSKLYLYIDIDMGNITYSQHEWQSLRDFGL